MTWSVTGSPGSPVEMTIANHPALGGDGSGPCPGELLAMALAACMDGTIRMTADLMEIELDRIRVEVVKLRGAAMANSAVLNMLRGQTPVEVSWS